MNEINAAQRKRGAAQELAEADKIKIVTAAEAEAEKDRLHGVGIAQQRRAIVDGFAESIEEFKNANVGLSEDQIMAILPSGPSAVDDIRTQMLSALKAAGTTAPTVERTHDLEQVQGEYPLPVTRKDPRAYRSGVFCMLTSSAGKACKPDLPRL